MSQPRHGALSLAIGLLTASSAALADGTQFSDFTPLASSAGPSAYEGTPLILSNPSFEQRTIGRRQPARRPEAQFR